MLIWLSQTEVLMLKLYDYIIPTCSNLIYILFLGSMPIFLCFPKTKQIHTQICSKSLKFERIHLKTPTLRYRISYFGFVSLVFSVLLNTAAMEMFPAATHEVCVGPNFSLIYKKHHINTNAVAYVRPCQHIHLM